MEELRNQRLEKLKKLEEMGVSPFAYNFPRTHLVQDILDLNQKGKGNDIHVQLVGRLMAIRRMGKASFAHIMDRSGRIQIYVRKDLVTQNGFEVFSLLDIGDIVGICGTVFTTQTGEITVLVQELQLLSKSLRPLPVVKEKIQEDEKILYDQFADRELRYRQRYVDLLVNADVKNVFILRSKIISHMRQYLEKKGYIEVETPVLQPLYGGAFAKPFITHHNTLDTDFYLRIADELYMKRLIVGGFDGVFEIAKDFRNEGMDRNHNPEFTMMELYVAYEDYEFMMDLVEDMIGTMSMNVLGEKEFTYQDKVIALAAPWERIAFFDAIQRFTGYDLYKKDMDELKKIAVKIGLDINESTRGKIIEEIFSQFVEPNLIQPTFIMDYPLELSPLAKRHRSKEGLVERFETYIAGKEICNAFSELNDPLDQRKRFEDQARSKAQGDEDAMVIDEDYIRAMEYGMPPTAGLGVGIDRLVMLMTNSATIRDVILFPQMRPERT